MPLVSKRLMLILHFILLNLQKNHKLISIPSIPINILWKNVATRALHEFHTFYLYLQKKSNMPEIL